MAQANSRRDFLKVSGTVMATAAFASVAPRAHAAGSDTIKVALVGCGGRGGGAALNALSTSGPVQLVALADVFENRLKGCLTNLQNHFKAKPERVDVPPERCFVGFDGYQKALEAVGPGGVALLCTPPAFRPLHVEYAVSKGCHVFMEKSFGVDAPGVRRILAAGALAQQKGLKVAGGLMSRHYTPLEQAVAKIHEGAIGNVITAWAYRVHGQVGYGPRRQGESDLAHQIRNYSCFTWLNGSFLLDWLIHNLDVCCWVKNAWPVSAQGQGGRQVRTATDQLFDHYAVEYTFPDGTRMLAQGRHIDNTWGFFGDVIHGTTGSAVLGEGISEPRLYKGYKPAKENVIWQYEGPACNHYQYEHDLLFDAICNNKPLNETERCCKAAMVGILGRMAAESGQLITWEQAMNSKVELAPNLDKLTWDSTPPVAADAAGNYPVAKPGVTKVL